MRRFRSLIEGRANENWEMTVVLPHAKQQAVGAFRRFKHITKEKQFYF